MVDRPVKVEDLEEFWVAFRLLKERVKFNERNIKELLIENSQTQMLLKDRGLTR